MYYVPVMDMDKRIVEQLMGPEDTQRRLAGRTKRPWMFENDPITSAITSAAEALLLHCPAGPHLEEQRREYVGALCAAAAHSLCQNTISVDVKVNLYFGLEPNPPWMQPTSWDLSQERLTAAAAAVGDMHQLQTLLDEGVDPHVKSRVFGFPVEQAARLGRTDMVSLLLDFTFPDTTPGGASPGQTAAVAAAAVAALDAASRAGHEPVGRFLLESKEKIHLSSTDIEAAVMSAAQYGHVEVVLCFLEQMVVLKSKAMMDWLICRAAPRAIWSWCSS